MSMFYEVSNCLEIDSDEKPSFVHGITRQTKGFFCVDKSILFCEEFSTISSFTHASRIVQLAIPPDNSLVLFIDDLGTLNLFIPGEDRGLFNLSEFGRIRYIRLVATDKDQFDFFLVTEETILYWKNLDTSLFQSIFNGEKSRQLKNLFSKVIKISCSNDSLITSAMINSIVWTVEIIVSASRALVPDDESPCFECLKDPLGYLDIQPNFKKCHVIHGTGYCLALTTDGLLYLFNLVAGLCLGPLHALSGICDFSIGQAYERERDSTDHYPGLQQFYLIILRTPNENDELPISDGSYTGCCSLLLETIVFPKLERLNQHLVKPPVWLLSDMDVGSAEIMEFTNNQVLFAEFIQPITATDATAELATETKSFIRIQSLQTIDPTQSVYRLIKQSQFKEARRLVELFNLGYDVKQKVVIAELQWTLVALTDLSPAELLETVRHSDTHYMNSDGTQVCIERICQQMLYCLKDAEHFWYRQDLADRLLQVSAPNSNMQMELLLLLKEKILTDNRDDEPNKEVYITKVYAALKRLKTFLLLNGPDLFNPSSWNKFLNSDIYTLFAHYLTSGTTHHKDDPCDPSKAFLIWNLYKSDLMELLNRNTLERLCNMLLRRSLTFTPDNSEDFETRQERFVAAETAVHRWLRNELLCSVINKCSDAISTLVHFVIQRVKQLEACDPPYVVSSSLVSSSVNIPVCPFPWPSTAVSWTENFLQAASPVDTDEEGLYRTPGDKVNAYMAGLGSLDPIVDPLAELRKLAKQLRTIELLRKVYDCRLTLENCDAAAELSIAYRILDVPFNLGMSFSGGVDPLTAKYLEDRKIDLQTFYQGYAMDLCRRIKTAVEQTTQTVPVEEFSDGLTDSVECFPLRKVQPITPDPKVLVHQACVVADWITVPLCRIKVVTSLATLVPLPWPEELLTLVNNVLDHARSHGLLPKRSSRRYPTDELTPVIRSAGIPQLLRLDRLASVARVHEILSRYSLTDVSFSGTCTKNAHGIALQAISCIFYHFSNPFSGNPTPLGSETTALDERVIRDCEVIARELIASPDWAVWFARTRMQLVLEMASDLYETSSDELDIHPDNFEQRCSFVLQQLESTTRDLYAEIVDTAGVKSITNTAPYLLLKRFLGLSCLRSIESTFHLLPVEESAHTVFLVELAVCIANAVIWSQNSHQTLMFKEHAVNLVDSAQFSQWLHKHRCGIQSVADVVHIVGSLRQLPLSSMSERCTLVSRLTSCYAQNSITPDLLAVGDRNLLSLKRAYEVILPDLTPSNRGELLVWNWCRSSLQLACSILEDKSVSAEDESLRSVSTFVLQCLQTLCRSVTNASVGSKSMETQIKLSSPATPRSLLAACGFCVRLWGSPLGRLGYLLQMCHDTVLPLLVSLISKAAEIHPDEFTHSLSVVSQWMHCLFTLVIRVVGQTGVANVTEGNHCSCQIQIVLPQIQGLLQILQSYDVFFSKLVKAQSTSALDSLNQWTFSPMFDEAPNACNDVSLSCCTMSLRWLSDFFSWLLSLHPHQTKPIAPNVSLSSEMSDESPTDLERLLNTAVEVASTWASVYNLRMRASLPLLIGLQRLVCYKLKRDLWTEETQPTINDNETRISSSVELSRGYRERWSALCARWTVSTLEAVLNPADGQYLDQVLVLSLALAAPIEDATSVVRSVVASGRDAPKKIKAVAGIMYVFAVVAPERGSNFLTLSRSMMKTWGWRAALKPYGLNLSHLLTRGVDDAAFEAVLNKLCRIVPAPIQSPNEPPIGFLLPNDRNRVADPFSSNAASSDRHRLLPPLRVIVCFAEDFGLSLKTALLNHLKALFTSFTNNSIASDIDQPAISLEFPQITAFGDNGPSSNAQTDEETSINTTSFRTYHHLLLRRANLVLKRLMSFSKRRSCNEMLTLLRGFYSATSPYEYERLHFLLTWIQVVSPDSLEPERVELLKLLENYKRVSFPTDQEREMVLSKTGEDLFSFSTTETIHPLSRVRMPFHPLLSKSPPMNIISPEVTMNTISFWLKVNSLMEWNISDSLRLMTAKNLVAQYDRAGLLPLMGPRKPGLSSISTAAGWDRALPCQTVLYPLFASLRSLLESVLDQPKVMSFLAMLSRQVLYGPHRLSLLQLAKDLAATWLEKLDMEARSSYASEESTWREPCRSDGLRSRPNLEDSDDYQADPAGNHLEQRHHWTQMALERAEASHKQLAMEACLYQHHLADWEEVNQQLSNPKELIQCLLSKVAAILTHTSDPLESKISSLPVSQLSLRQRLFKALPKLANLAKIDYSDLGSRILLNRLHLPAHILSLNQSVTGLDTNMSDQSVLLDTSIGEGRPGLCDITLNATMTQEDAPVESASKFAFTDRAQPSEEDFVVAELILRDPTVRCELLPNLHMFVFTGDPNAYLAARWRAARCVLRTQLGMLIWPRLSVVELHSTLLRLSILADSNIPSHQRLLIDSSETRASSKGGTFTRISPPRILTCVKQLLASSTNQFQATELSGQLIADFDLVDPQIITKFVAMIHKHVTKHTTPYLLRIIDYLLSTNSPWNSLCWLDYTVLDQGILTTEQFLSDLMHHLISGAAGATRGHPEQPGQLFSRLALSLIGWPFPDRGLERAIVRWAPQFIIPSAIQPHQHTSSGELFMDLPAMVRVWVLANVLCLFAVSCSTTEVAVTLNECVQRIYNWNNPRERFYLTTQAIKRSELHLTADCFNV